MKRIIDWSQIRHGDIGFIAGEGFVSEAIRTLTERMDLLLLPTPSHAFLILSKTETIEALEKTVVRPVALYKQRFEAGLVFIYRPDVPDSVRRLAIDWVYDNYKGAAYGWGQILGFLPVMAWRKLTGQDPVNLLPVGTICSELVLLFLRKEFKLCASLGHHEQAIKLAWVTALSKDTTDPALELACCQRDSLPPNYAGKPT